MPEARFRRAPPGGPSRGRMASAAWLIAGIGLTFSLAVMADPTMPKPTRGSPMGGAAASIAASLEKVDLLLSEIEARIGSARRQAQNLLDRADAAQDPDEQSRLEELHGRFTAVAERLEDQRSRLQETRDELTAAGMRP